eukprot:587493-Lingulodinium_polyedra.AAC.1
MVVVRCDRREDSGRIEARVGTGYAGCRETRKPTSGGAIKLGARVVKGWSNVQSAIAFFTRKS